MDAEGKKRCPHCDGRLTQWLNPDDSSWGGDYQLVCFNDECPYYKRGWEWMRAHYNVTASYRYRFNPENGAEGPLPVWTPTAGRGNIVEEGE